MINMRFDDFLNSGPLLLFMIPILDNEFHLFPCLFLVFSLIFYQEAIN